MTGDHSEQVAWVHSQISAAARAVGAVPPSAEVTEAAVLAHARDMAWLDPHEDLLRRTSSMCASALLRSSDVTFPEGSDLILTQFAEAVFTTISLIFIRNGILDVK